MLPPLPLFGNWLVAAGSLAETRIPDLSLSKPLLNRSTSVAFSISKPVNAIGMGLKADSQVAALNDHHDARE